MCWWSNQSQTQAKDPQLQDFEVANNDLVLFLSSFCSKCFSPFQLVAYIVLHHFECKHLSVKHKTKMK